MILIGAWSIACIVFESIGLLAVAILLILKFIDEGVTGGFLYRLFMLICLLALLIITIIIEVF